MKGASRIPLAVFHQSDFVELSLGKRFAMENCSSNPPLEGCSTWAEVVKGEVNFHGGKGLHFEPLGAGAQEVQITTDDVEEEMAKWSNALVGQVLGARVPFQQMKRFVDSNWSEFGEIDVVLLKSGLFVFKCGSDEAKSKIMEQAPWPFLSKMLYVKPWSPNLDLTEEEFDAVPIWVKLPNLKLHYYSASCLTKIASYIGSPLFTDKQTADQSRLSYTRVCVEIKADSCLPQSVPILNEFGEKAWQEITYEWLPPVCNFCNKFGHTEAKCEAKPRIRQVWIPKCVTTDSAEGCKNEDKDEMGATVNNCARIAQNCATTEVGQDEMGAEVKEATTEVEQNCASPVNEGIEEVQVEESEGAIPISAIEIVMPEIPSTGNAFAALADPVVEPKARYKRGSSEKKNNAHKFISGRGKTVTFSI